jgi:hypothetical protein
MTHQAASIDAERFSQGIRLRAIAKPRAAGTTHFGHKASIDILSGAFRQLPALFRKGADQGSRNLIKGGISSYKLPLTGWNFGFIMVLKQTAASPDKSRPHWNNPKLQL